MWHQNLEQVFQEISTRFQKSDSINNDDEFFTDIRNFNCRGNTEKSKFYVFWGAVAWVIEIDNGTGAYKRRHAAEDKETNNNVSYAPNVLSIQELMDKAKYILTKKYGIKEGVDFIVPYLSWVYLQP